MKPPRLAFSARAIIVFGSFSLLASLAPAQTLLHHWKLDGDATDSAGTADGTELGGPGYAAGQFGQAVSLDGVDDYIAAGLGTIVPATDYTMTAWVFWEAGNGSRGYIAGAQNSGSQGEVFTMGRSANGSDRKLFLNLLANGGQGNSITESPDSTISTDTWQHVAYTVDSTNGTTIYLNGAPVESNPVRSTHDPATTPFHIGNNPNTGAPNLFDGLIDDVAIFDGVLDSTQLSDVISLGAENFNGSDPTPPELSATNPAGGETGVPVTSELVATFNKTVRATASGTITLRRTDPDELVESFDVTDPSQVMISGPTVTIEPSSNLVGGVGYYVLIEAGAIEDTAGNDYAGLGVIPPDTAAWSFTADGTAPTSSTMEPMTGAPGVTPYADLTLTFDEEVQVGTGDITIHLASGGSVVETIEVTGDAVTINGLMVTIDIAALDLNTAYYVNIPGGAFTDLSGNPYAGITGATAWSFTTVATALIHHWEFEGDATDSAGTHDGTLEGDATFAAGVIGQAASLDGDGDSIFVGQSSLPATDYTLTAWVLRETAVDRMYVAGTQQSGNAGAFLRMDETSGDGQIFFNMLPPADSKRAWGGSVALDTWTHLAVSVSSTGGLVLYVDGAPVASDPAGTDYTTHDNFRIGARPDGGTFGFDGFIDDVRIYAAVLSESEIAALAAGGSAPLVLKISQNGGNLNFDWNSKNGMQYDLVTSTDLTTPVATWAVYDDGVNPPYENIPTNGMTTSLTGVVKVDATRFFALIEEEIPPLLFEGFEAGIPIDWIPADNGQGTAWQAGDPTSGPLEGPDAAATGTNCAGTNITGLYTANADVTLTSPAIAIPAGGASLRFKQYIDTDFSGDVGSLRLLDADNADAEITDGDFPVLLIEGIEAGWTARTFPFPAAALGKNVKVRFQFVSDADVNVFSGFYVDDVVVRETTP